MSYKKPLLMSKIINLLTDIIIEHLSFQIKKWSRLVQIFDTHSNVLDFLSMEEYSINPIRKKYVKNLKKRHPKTPISYFSKILIMI